MKKISDMSESELKEFTEQVVKMYQKNHKARKWSDLSEREKNEVINRKVAKNVVDSINRELKYAREFKK